MVIIAIHTTKPIDLKGLKSLLDSAKRKQGCPWGSTKVIITRADPSIKIVEQYFSLGMFASMKWVECSGNLFTKANYAIIADRRHKIIKKIALLKEKSSVKFFKSYTIT